MSKYSSTKAGSMKLRKYVKVLPCEKDETILVNLINKAIIKVPNKVISTISETGETTPSIRTILDQMNHLGFLVEDSFDDHKDIQNQLRSLICSSAIFSSYILLTYACNMNCVYCYEGSLTNNLGNMTFEVTKKTVNWIIEQIRNDECRVLDITFFGGEPLLNTKSLFFLADELGSYAKSSGIQTCFYVVTNGTKLTKDLAQRLQVHGINGLQVTIDGSEQVHNSMRPLRNNKESFGLIMENLQNLFIYAPKIRVTLNVNVSQENYYSIFELINNLAAQDFNHHCKINFSTIMSGNRSSNQCNPDFSLHETVQLAASQRISLYRFAIASGFKLNVKSFLRTGACINKKENSFVIDPGGKIYKCPTGVGVNEFFIGSIEDANNIIENFQSKFIKLETWNNQVCLDCCYLPLCLGGCRFLSFIKTSRMNRQFCQKDIYESDIETIKYIYS